MYLLRKIKSFFLILIVLGFVAGMGYGGYYLATQTPQAQPDYVIQFDGNGVTVPENKVHSKQNETIVLPELEKEGYLFDGWYTSEGVKWTNSTLVTKNVSLVAKWVPKKYDITLKKG